MPTRRRAFLQQVALAGGAAQAQTSDKPAAASVSGAGAQTIGYPRVFRGRQLATIAFPLGGVGAGSVSLGGRGQLKDWEIFNRPDKGNALSYAFPCIWAQAGSGKPVARVLESRMLPPFEGQNGLGSQNAPGLTRLARATFTGEFPLARIDFDDPQLPVKVSLEAFTPFIPHEPDDSGLPVAILRYQITNPNTVAARVSVAWSIDNPVGGAGGARERPGANTDTRLNQYRKGSIEGLLMTNPDLPADAPLKGSFALGLLDVGDGKVTYLRGWPRGRWWNAPMLFWDDFLADGSLGPESEQQNRIGALCLERTVAPLGKAHFTFALAWHFPNRTPERCGWRAPAGAEKTLIGNWYTTKFAGAWEAAVYLAANLPQLEKKTRSFVQTMRDSSLPAAVKDAATANLSTLVSTTCFRTADGEFHGFEGVNNKAGCCFGSCTHVWNYETTTAFLFPSLARSLRKASFGYPMDDAGAMHFRQFLPDGKARLGFAATDGQMGQILHAYLDWRLSGDMDWLRAMWPRIKKGIEFAWVPGGWDADKDGVMEGVQHNTYDVEFYGPNPECGVYYLGGLRAAEEMARAVGDTGSADEYRRLFDNGSKWIDANLFNGEYYIQKIRGFTKDQIAPNLRSQMGSDDTQKPEYQVGEGCLVDQLIGQYLADIAGLGPLLDPKNIRKALESIQRYNYRQTLEEHDSVQRIYAVNDEPALLICDYGKAPRPRIPFPYYAEAWTGLEYMVGAQMIYAGMVKEGVQAFHNVRVRHDGERRNPYDEPECGHHYARAMSAWSGVVALSGFLFHGHDQSIRLTPRTPGNAKCFWSTATAWGFYELTHSGKATQASIHVLHGSLPCSSFSVQGSGAAHVILDSAAVAHQATRENALSVLRFAPSLVVKEGSKLVIDLAG